MRDVLEGKGSEVVTIGPDLTVHEAIESLVTHRIGAVVVTNEDGGVAGILTERDILRIVGREPERLKTARVREFMTKDLVYAVADDDLEYAMSMMTEKRFRHLPVMDGNALAGIVSIGDVVKAMNSAREFEIRLLRQYIDSGTAS
jgi:CBS domain-containing protein